MHIPIQSGRPFRSNSAGDSDSIRAVISVPINQQPKDKAMNKKIF
jgi:hypothetical protein